MDEVENFLITKLDKAISNIEKSKHPVLSDCLNKEINQLRDWIKQNKQKIGKEKLYFLNNVIAEWQMVLNKHKYYCAPRTIMIANNVYGSLKKIKNELEAGPVDNMLEAGKDGKKSFTSDRWISPSVDETKIYGIDDELMVMERLLVGKESKVGFEAIAIVGVTGVGKTTFCQVVFNNQVVRKNFAPRIWVYLSKQSMEDKDYKKKVVKNILMCLGYEDKLIDQIGCKESDGLRRLLLALRLKLTGKKYLIVLDGDWNSDERLTDFCSSLTKDDNDQDQLAYGLPKGDDGTVIIMSRSKKLAAYMFGEKNLHRLLPHADDEICWKVFSDTVGQDKLTEDTKKLKVEIVKNCAGLPLVAKMLGQIMLQKIYKNHSENYMD